MASGDKIFIADKATLDVVSNKATTIESKVDTVTSKVDTANSNINSLTSRGFVKSIQRGQRIFSTTVTLTYSSVNANKSIILLETLTGATQPLIGAVVTSFTNTSATILFGNEVNVSWQVIEFY